LFWDWTFYFLDTFIDLLDLFNQTFIRWARYSRADRTDSNFAEDKTFHLLNVKNRRFDLKSKLNFSNNLLVVFKRFNKKDGLFSVINLFFSRWRKSLIILNFSIRNKNWMNNFWIFIIWNIFLLSFEKIKSEIWIF